MTQTRFSGLKDLLVGAIYILVGAAAFVLSHSYRIGTLFQMGPGFYPALVSVILLGLGVLSVFNGLRQKAPDPITKVGIEPLILIIVGVLSFAFLIERVGLVVAVAALIFFACFRRLLTNPIEVLATYVVLATFSVLVFIYGFGLPVQPFWWH